MLRYEDQSCLNVIRKYLDEVSYCYLNYRLIPGHDSTIFPEFGALHGLLKSFNNIFRFLFTLFRQGHAAEEQVLRDALPSEFFEALVAAGLLVQNKRRQWQTPGLAIIPIEGLYLVVSLPPHYPTATTRQQPVYLGIESIWLTRALPSQLNGRQVLDVCAGSGIQGLICAARGASRVVGLEKSDLAVNVARFNVALNRLSNVVEIRKSDLLCALEVEDRFDFVVSNPPFMPVAQEVEYPICGNGGADGTVVLRSLFEALPAHLADRVEGVLFCNALGDQYSVNFNREFMHPFAERHGLFIRAYVTDKGTISEYSDLILDANIKNALPELSAEERRGKIANWLQELRRKGVRAECFYGQIIRFWKGRTPGFANLPVYKPEITDPLLGRAMMAKNSR